MFPATVTVEYYGFHGKVLSDLVFLYIMYKYHLINQMSVILSSDKAAMKLTLCALTRHNAFFCLFMVNSGTNNVLAWRHDFNFEPHFEMVVNLMVPLLSHTYVFLQSEQVVLFCCWVLYSVNPMIINTGASVTVWGIFYHLVWLNVTSVYQQPKCHLTKR